MLLVLDMVEKRRGCEVLHRLWSRWIGPFILITIRVLIISGVLHRTRAAEKDDDFSFLIQGELHDSKLQAAHIFLCSRRERIMRVTIQ